MVVNGRQEVGRLAVNHAVRGKKHEQSLASPLEVHLRQLVIRFALEQNQVQQPHVTQLIVHGTRVTGGRVQKPVGVEHKREL